MHIKKIPLTRIVLIEKSHNTKKERFPFTSKGLKESFFFIESLGGWDEVYKKKFLIEPIFTPSTAYLISMSNVVWKNLNNNKCTHTITK